MEGDKDYTRAITVARITCQVANREEVAGSNGASRVFGRELALEVVLRRGVKLRASASD